MKEETARKKNHLITVVQKERQDVKKKRECGELIERSKKSNEELSGGSFQVKALLIRRNFW
jgi:hypothetical protein